MFLHLLLPVAKKLGGKLEVVSFDEDLEGECVGHEPPWSWTQSVETEQGVCGCAAEGKPPAAPAGLYASETDRTYVVLSWKAPAYSSKAPMWYYIEKVPHERVNGVLISAREPGEPPGEAPAASAPPHLMLVPVQFRWL